MRPTQNMKKVLRPPEGSDKRPQLPAPNAPGAQVTARRKQLELKLKSIRELTGSAMLTQTMTAGRELIQELAKAALQGKKEDPQSQPGSTVPANLPAKPPTKAEAAKIEEAERKALEAWKGFEKDSQERLALRIRRGEATLRALTAYQSARARGLGGPKNLPRKPEKG
ncbi:hypothetical protein [Corallococcus carmarthensis]|uniref:Uncharacterized protein n=1 Tax=Corallococcus carmarthensis TaxID=2316728 RepID=A0A3A8K7C0_9BACT|nr:hypothetical protein [Corallococcus carmarthensis]RKH03416.1 hypothetical protein D7X32_14060 [Corallococcus carmarthensis]